MIGLVGSGEHRSAHFSVQLLGLFDHDVAQV
jgi:hypothetical protein